MPLEDILKKIDEKASTLKEEIVTSSRSEAESRIKEATEKAALFEARILEEARAKAAQTESIAASRADMQRKQVVLGAKQGLISKVFNEVVRRFSALPKEEYRSLLLEMLSRKSGGNEQVILSENDRARLGSDFLAAANKRLEEQGKAGQLTVSYVSNDLGGGFILKKGGVSDNVTFPAIVSLIQEDLEIELAQMLFEKLPEKESTS